MRQYRGLTKDGKWVYGWYLRTRFAEVHWIIKDGLYVTDILIGINPKFPKQLQGCYKVIPETVGQQTGLKDKNAKEIYEGDICKAYYPCGSKVSDKLIVKWSGMGFVISDNYRNATIPHQIEVIGNVHENPHLMEKDNG